MKARKLLTILGVVALGFLGHPEADAQIPSAPAESTELSECDLSISLKNRIKKKKKELEDLDCYPDNEKHSQDRYQKIGKFFDEQRAQIEDECASNPAQIQRAFLYWTEGLLVDRQNTKRCEGLGKDVTLYHTYDDNLKVVPLNDDCVLKLLEETVDKNVRMKFCDFDDAYYYRSPIIYSKFELVQTSEDKTNRFVFEYKYTGGTWTDKDSYIYDYDCNLLESSVAFNKDGEQIPVFKYIFDRSEKEIRAPVEGQFYKKLHEIMIGTLTKKIAGVDRKMNEIETRLQNYHQLRQEINELNNQLIETLYK